jgi:hypothetical protein
MIAANRPVREAVSPHRRSDRSVAHGQMFLQCRKGNRFAFRRWCRHGPSKEPSWATDDSFGRDRVALPIPVESARVVYQGQPDLRVPLTRRQSALQMVPRLGLQPSAGPGAQLGRPDLGEGQDSGSLHFHRAGRGHEGHNRAADAEHGDGEAVDHDRVVRRSHLRCMSHMPGVSVYSGVRLAFAARFDEEAA